MTTKTSPPVWNYNQIKAFAEDFLRNYHPELTIPVPVEAIVELRLGIKISTIIGLREECDTDGFINSNFKEIILDDEVFNRYEERTRFTIAHELGHKFLHAKIFEQFNIQAKEEYLKFQNSLAEKDQKWLEFQANVFAACVLVPTKKLKEEITLAVGTQNIREMEADYLFPFLKDLPARFKVSPEVLFRRIQKEEILLG